MPVDVGHGWAAAGRERPASPMTRNRSSAFPGSRGVACFAHLPGIGQHGTTHQTVPINPADLDATLEKDQKNHDGFDHSSA
jgi:hypothetical protein